MKKQILCLIGLFMASFAPAATDDMRLTRFTQSTTDLSTNAASEETTSYGYNQEGFVNDFTRVADGSSNTIRYEYTWECPGVWNTRTSSDSVTVTRTFHDNGSVASSTVSTMAGGVVECLEYDEEGVLVAGTTYSNGSPESVYFKPLNKWLLNNRRTTYEVNAKENSYKELTLSGKTVRSATENWYTPNGVQVASFYESFSEPGSAQGTKAAFEDGKIIVTEYDLQNIIDGSEYVASSKTVYSDNWFDARIYAPGVTYAYGVYNVDADGNDIVVRSCEEQWVKENILRSTVTYNATNKVWNMYSLYYNNGIKEYSDIYFDESTGCHGYTVGMLSLEAYYRVSNYPSGSVSRLFDADGALLWEIKNYDNVWSKKNLDTGEWTPLTGNIKVYYGSNYIWEYELDENSRPKTGLQIFGGTTMRYEYKFTADGKDFDIKGYVLSEDNTDLYLSNHDIKTTENGVVTYTTESRFEAQGPISYSRTSYDYNTNIQTNYRFEDGEWTPYRQSGMTTINYLADSTIYEIVDHNNEGQNTIKTVGPVARVDNSTYLESYKWDLESSSWVPQTRYVYVYSPTDIDSPVKYYVPVDPENDLYDYFHPAGFDAHLCITKSIPEENCINTMYKWDSGANDWAVSSVSRNTYSVSVEGSKTTFNYVVDDKKYTYVFDTETELLLSGCQEGGLIDNIQEIFTYDNEWRVIKKETITDTEHIVKEYTYADLSGVESVSTEANLRFTGTAVEAETSIELYTIAGVMVGAADRSFSTVGLTPGIYIARAASETLKIVVK